MDGGGLSPIYPAGIDSGYSKQICIGTNTAINGMELTIVGSQTVTGKLSVGTTTTIADTALNVVGTITVSQGIKFGDNTSLTSANGLGGSITSGSVTTALGYTPVANNNGSVTTALGYTPLNINGGTVTGNLGVTGTITAGNLTTTTSLSLGKHYAQLSSTVNQQPGTTSPVVVTFNQNDQIQGLTHSTVANTGSITVNKTGVYAIFAGAQVGRTSGATTINADMWIRVNNVDIVNSNVRNSVKQADDTKVLINTSGILLNAGDYVNVMQSVDDAGVGAGLIATSPVGEPVIPSIILTIYEL